MSMPSSASNRSKSDMPANGSLAGFGGVGAFAGGGVGAFVGGGVAALAGGGGGGAAFIGGGVVAFIGATFADGVD